MTTFDDRFNDRAAAKMLAEFGETIIYRPRGGAPRSIQAMVDRGPPQVPGGSVGTLAPFVVVEVRNSCTTGIRESDVDTGGDQIDVPLKSGGAMKSLSIKRVQSSQDSGMVRLECG
jgi:hypothetical protein